VQPSHAGSITASDPYGHNGSICHGERSGSFGHNYIVIPGARSTGGCTPSRKRHAVKCHGAFIDFHACTWSGFKNLETHFEEGKTTLNNYHDKYEKVDYTVL